MVHPPDPPGPPLLRNRDGKGDPFLIAEHISSKNMADDLFSHSAIAVATIKVIATRLWRQQAANEISDGDLAAIELGSSAGSQYN